MSSRDVARDVSIQTGRPVSTPYLGAVDGLPSGAILTEGSTALTTESGDVLVIE